VETVVKKEEDMVEEGNKVAKKAVTLEETTEV